MITTKYELLTMSGQSGKDSDINSSSESDQLLLQQFLESSVTEHLEKPGILNTFCSGFKSFLAPTGGQEMLIFIFHFMFV